METNFALCGWNLSRRAPAGAVGQGGGLDREHKGRFLAKARFCELGSLHCSRVESSNRGRVWGNRVELEIKGSEKVITGANPQVHWQEQ